MAALQFLDDAHKDLVPLVDLALLVLDAGLVEMVKIFESFVQLDHPIDHQEGL